MQAMSVHGSRKSISPAELHELMKGGQAVEVLDVRSRGEFGSVHVPGARSLPLNVLDPRAFMAGRKGKQTDPLFVICQSGGRSSKACTVFEEAGFGDQVVNVEGGTAAWVKAGLPVERGERKIMPLDRRMRMVIGLLVLLGVALGALVNPWFYGLSVFCGVALVYARLTNR